MGLQALQRRARREIRHVGQLLAQIPYFEDLNGAAHMHVQGRHEGNKRRAWRQPWRSGLRSRFRSTTSAVVGGLGEALHGRSAPRAGSTSHNFLVTSHSRVVGGTSRRMSMVATSPLVGTAAQRGVWAPQAVSACNFQARHANQLNAANVYIPTVHTTTPVPDEALRLFWSSPAQPRCPCSTSQLGHRLAPHNM